MLIESEIFDYLSSNFKQAAEDCELLSKLPAQGPTYNRFRHTLLGLEDACRQAAHWREDSRWLPIGLMLEQCHQRAGGWLRRHHPRPLFLKLAENLRNLQYVTEDLRDKATGHFGAILPEHNVPIDRVAELGDTGHKDAGLVQVKVPNGSLNE